jgi:hypothetical protein
MNLMYRYTEEQTPVNVKVLSSLHGPPDSYRAIFMSK